MKMKLYYVAKKGEGSLEGFEVEYVVGPMSWRDAMDYLGSLVQSWEYEVVEQEIEVS